MNQNKNQNEGDDMAYIPESAKRTETEFEPTGEWNRQDEKKVVQLVQLIIAAAVIGFLVIHYLL